MKKMKWTKEEINFLKEFFNQKSKISLNEISKKIQKRTHKSIGAKLSELGFSIPKHNKKIALKSKQKQCTKCKILKNKSEFYKEKKSIDGFHIYCKDCLGKKQKIYKLKNLDKVKLRNKVYRERIKKEDPDRLKNYDSKYRNSARGHYTKIKQRVEKRNTGRLEIDFKKFEEWYDCQNNECHYCGISHENFMKVRKKITYAKISRYKSFTIDRKNNSRNYSLDNICISCGLCNYLKGWIFSENDFKQISKEHVIPYFKELTKDIS